MPQQRTTPCVCAYCQAEFLGYPRNPRMISDDRFCSRTCRAYSNNRSRRHTAPAIERFSALVDHSAPLDGCWPWRDKLDARGYGRFRSESFQQRVGAHRFAIEQRLDRPLAPGMFALHTCDNPPCVRNDGDEGTYEVNGVVRIRFGHLWEGTHVDNMADMVAKGRQKYLHTHWHPDWQVRGETHPKTRLTEDQVRAIRRRAAAGELQKNLAVDYDVVRSAISKIVRRECWTHIE